MLIIEYGNVIKITRGDTLTLTVNITKDGQSYTPVAGDTIRFALATGYVGQKGYNPILTKDIPIDTLTFTLSAEETQNLKEQKYNYDIQITHVDGCVDTFISSTMVMLAEVE
jgi:hypothetical protein